MSKGSEQVEKDDQKPPIRYRILGSIMIDVQIRNIPGLSIQAIAENADKFVYRTRTKLGVRDNRFVDVILTHAVTLDLKSIGLEGETVEVISMTPITTFEMQGVEPHLDEEGLVVMDKNLIMGLLNSALGTSRGMFWGTVMGTQYGSLTLPLFGFDQMAQMVENYERVVHRKDVPNDPQGKP